MDKDVSGIEDERTAVLLDARALANKQIAHAWEQLEIFEWPRFPRKAKTNPLFEKLAPLRESYQRLKDFWHGNIHNEATIGNKLQLCWRKPDALYLLYPPLDRFLCIYSATQKDR